MTKELGEQAKALLLDQASGRLARALDVGQRISQRWLAGTAAMPPDVAEWISRQDAAMRAADLPNELRVLVEEALRKGLHPEVIAAHLASMYQDLMGRNVE